MPVLLEPIAGQITPALDTKLMIGAITDSDFEPVSIRFEVYSDSLLLNLIETTTAGPVGFAGTTASPLLENLQAGQRYWWRTQSFDSVENSDW